MDREILSSNREMNICSSNQVQSSISFPFKSAVSLLASVFLSFDKRPRLITGVFDYLCRTRKD
jgi:hypothetical protein